MQHAQADKLRGEPLERLARGEPLRDVLTALVHAVERELPGWIASILLVDGGRLRHGAAPGLPEAYQKAVDGIPVGEGFGSCGTCAARGQRVIVEDIATDPLWEPYRGLAHLADVAACASDPILGPQGAVLGTLAIYSRHPGRPTDAEFATLQYVVRLAGIAIESKAREDRLRVYEAAFQTARDAILITEAEPIDPPGPRILMANPAFFAMTGYTPGEVIGQSPRMLQGLGTSRAALDTIRAALKDWKPVRVEVQNYRKDAEPFWAEMDISPVADETGWFTHWVSVQRDTTKRKATEDALRESERRLRTIIEYSPAAIAMFDPDMRYVMHSRRWVRDYRLSTESLVGQSHYDVFPEIPDRWKEIHRRCLAGATEFCEEDPFPRADGTTDHVRWLVQPWHDPLGAIGGIVIFSEVITDKVRAREERQRLDEQLRETQKLESLGVLAGGIAHDFNNLLTTVLGYTNLARTNLADTAAVRGWLEHIEESSRRAADLCQQMLAYAGKGRLSIGPVNLTVLVREALRLLQLSVSKKAGLDLKLAADLPAVEADATQMQQVIMNLVMNASEAIGEDGGTITLTTRALDADRRQLDDMLLGTERPPGRYVCLEVVDTGHGMDAATRDRIFEPFFTTKFVGRGLGLSATLGIVRSHHGAIRVESEPGAGTLVRLVFPVTDAVPLVTTPVEAPVGERKWDGTVLIADDEEGIRSLAALLVRLAGFDVIEARDGQEAVELFRQHRGAIRAVLLDLTMPRLDGPQAFAEIHRLAPEVPVVVMSGYSKVELTQRFAQAAPRAFLQKPFTRASLMARLTAALDRS